MDWLDLKDAAAITGRDVSYLRALCDAGEVHARKVPIKEGGKRLKWQISLASLEEGSNVVSYEKLIAKWKMEMKSGYHTGAKLEPGTIRMNLAGMTSIWKYLGAYDPKMDKWLPIPASLEDFTVDTVRRALAAIPSSKPGVAPNMYRGSKSFYKLLVREGLRPKEHLSQFKEFKPGKNKNPKRTYLRNYESDYQKLLAVNEAWRTGKSEYSRLLTHTVIEILYHTGMRAGEACNLMLTDINYKESLLYIRKTKTKEPREVGIRPELMKSLDIYLSKRPTSNLPNLLIQEDGAALSTDSVWRRIRSLGKKAGIPITPHGLRHTLATSLLLEGIPPTKVMRITGHRTLTALQIYNRTTDEDALDVLRGRRRPEPQQPTIETTIEF